jgi:hypothetical protein
VLISSDTPRARMGTGSNPIARPEQKENFLFAENSVTRSVIRVGSVDLFFFALRTYDGYISDCEI